MTVANLSATVSAFSGRPISNCNRLPKAGLLARLSGVALRATGKTIGRHKVRMEHVAGVDRLNIQSCKYKGLGELWACTFQTAELAMPP